MLNTFDVALISFAPPALRFQFCICRPVVFAPLVLPDFFDLFRYRQDIQISLFPIESQISLATTSNPHKPLVKMGYSENRALWPHGDLMLVCEKFSQQRYK